ncbi:MAG: 1-acyl-sn-glycerol-3-phosphate acyltransferase [Nanoarchaeota archaeon]|nr:1-acyl-sn-glycerol-3-phosphate acyltransferase [Nanoarchaeota archaeon]
MKGFIDEGLAEKYRKRIRHDYDMDFYKKVAETCDKLKVPNWLFNKIIIEGEDNVKEVKDKQLFYVSNHVSMADFLVQGYTFWKYNLPIPRFIAGENLFHFPFNVLWKKCGAISLDRAGNRDYKEIFKNEIEKYILEGENFLLYPEGGRNYLDNGVKEFKTGLLGILVDGVEKGRDIYIAPIKSSYDKRIEERFLHKVQKNKKKRDTCLKEGKKVKAKMYDNLYFWWDVFAYFARPFSREKGNAYLSFGKVFSVRDFLEDVDKQKKVALADAIRSKIIEL